jgi:hypothetical protein
LISEIAIAYRLAVEGPSDIRRRLESLYEFGKEVVSQYIV